MSAKAQAAAPYAALLAAAAWLFHETARFAASGRAGHLGPAFWPRAVLVLLMIVCAIEIGRRVVGARGPAPAIAPAPLVPAIPEEPEAPRHPRLLAGGIALAIGYVWAMEAIGFFLSTALFLAAFMWVGRFRRPWIVAATSILGSLVFVFVFMKVVYVSLPLGVGPFRVFSAALMAALGIH